MKEIALISANGPIAGAVLGSLLERGLSVNVLSLYPERVMLDETRVTISRLDVHSEEAMREALEGYSTLVIANETDLSNDDLDNFILKSFDKALNAASQAGTKRVIVIGAKESNAFYLSHLNRRQDIDWVYFDTEGDFADRVANEIIEPRYHYENASF